jgi:flagellar basal-body rod modification protein FlgD
MDPITGLGASTTPTPSASSASVTGLADNFDTFLTLLTTQLQNQDPLSPLESNEFTQQLVQFSQVEQSIATNSNLEQVLGLLGSNNVASTVAYLGKDVAVAGGTNGLVDGAANWRYSVPAGAAEVSMTVEDASGKVVYAGQGEISTGTHVFDWDGKDNSGKQLEDGGYVLKVSAVDGNGEPLTAEVAALGRVTGVQSGTDGTELLLGTVAVSTDDVLQVTEPSPQEG